jgi:hypothetical protein
MLSIGAAFTMILNIAPPLRLHGTDLMEFPHFMEIVF